MKRAHGIVPSCCLLGIFLSLVASTASAQTAPPLKRVNGPPRHATLDIATGELARPGGGMKSLAACWVNTDTSGFFSLSGNCGGLDLWLSWGVKNCGQTGIISGFTFGYASNALDT